jgi:hypothetical protein
MALRAFESRLASVTGGNGAIYATRREAYLVVDAVMGHDLSFPFNLVSAAGAAVYRPGRAGDGEDGALDRGRVARKRRMMSHAWPIVVQGGLLDPRGYPPRYAFMVLSHRVLRYAAPFLHVLALGGARARAVLACSPRARSAGATGSRPLLVAGYYVLTQASIAAGL